MECRSEITWRNILSRLHIGSVFLYIVTTVVLWHFYTFYQSMIYVVIWFLWVIAVLLISETVVPLKNSSYIDLIGAALLAFLCSLGKSFAENYNQNGYGHMFIKMFFLFICWFILFLKSILVVQMLIERYPHMLHKPKSSKVRICFVICLIVNFLAYMPFFLVQYPGVLTGDSMHQMAQILGQETYSNHHPWYYTMLIGSLFKVGEKLGGTVNSGIATYTLFSVLFCSVCCAYAVTFLYKKGMKWYWLILLEITYAFDPIKAQMSVTMWKDVIFSGALLVMCILLADFHTSLNWLFSFYFIGLAVCLTRNNGFLIIISTFLLLLFFWKQHRKFLCRAFIPVIFVYLIMTKLMMPLIGVQDTEVVESLSIPLQQIAFTVCADGNISEKDYELINAVVETDKVKEQYCEWKSDFIKGIVRPKEKIIVENKSQYLLLWIRIGMKNPYCYLKAYVEQTKGYWYHKVDYKVCEPDGADGGTIGMKKRSLLSEIMTKRIKDWLYIFIYQIYSGFYSLGLQTWICIFVIIILLKNKFYWQVVIPVLLNIITLLIATPIFAEFRYAYSGYLLIPMCMGLLLVHRSETAATQ